jgi:hypothetical protein
MWVSLCNTTGVTYGAGTTNLCRPPEFTSDFSRVRVARSFVFCVFFVVRCLSFCPHLLFLKLVENTDIILLIGRYKTFNPLFVKMLDYRWNIAHKTFNNNKHKKSSSYFQFNYRGIKGPRYKVENVCLLNEPSITSKRICGQENQRA